MNKKLWVGVSLVFVSGIFYTRVAASIITVFFGGKLMNEEGILIDPPRAFHENGLIFIIYSIPFLLSGLYLIRKSTKTK